MTESKSDFAKKSTNPYKAPNAPANDDFIAYEPIRRPMLYTIAGSLGWFFAVLLVVPLAMNIPLLVEITTKLGFANIWSTRSGRMITITLIGSTFIAPIFAYAGHCFFKNRGRAGICLGILAFALGALVGRLTDPR